MRTACTPVQMEFQGLGRRKVMGTKNGSPLNSDGDAVHLRETDQRLEIRKRNA